MTRENVTVTSPRSQSFAAGATTPLRRVSGVLKMDHAKMDPMHMWLRVAAGRSAQRLKFAVSLIRRLSGSQPSFLMSAGVWADSSLNGTSATVLSSSGVANVAVDPPQRV
eukprot:CAMPEP_0171508106 /NCGR_PEP_ID=MMETSP0958-20121227/13971_1 /TAXON_ID=87120 /ORGANISM="Aurantiochytrium limacinum, Strain ATCCMYA-1381" /LENGTH=109 /DNA_ID=CAMNT_0012045079 /DNA_START=173 /DNA_END=503 /DNA_ORIENTATION=+